MTATSVTGIGTGSAEGPLRGYDIDNFRRVFVQQGTNLLAAVNLVGDKYILQPSGEVVSDGPVILNGLSIQVPNIDEFQIDGNPRGKHAVDFQGCRFLSTQVASGYYSFIANGCSNTASGSYSSAEGRYTTSTGHASHTEGDTTSAHGDSSHAEGNQAVANGTGSHAEGGISIASGVYSHAEGINTSAVGDGAHSEGHNTAANGFSSHSEGYATRAGNIARTFTISGTTVTIPGGDFTTEFPDGFIVRFFNLTGGTANSFFASSQVTSGVAFGGVDTTFDIPQPLSDRTGGLVVNIDIGVNAHAEGAHTVASGDQSHAEGIYSVASGSGSHAEGYGTIASGNYSHAQGVTTTSSDYASSSSGIFSVADKRGQFARANGKFAVVGDAQSTTTNLFILTTDGAGHELTLNGQAGFGMLGGPFGIPTGSNRFKIPSNTTVSATVRISARETSGSNAAFFFRKCCIQDVAGTVALVGAQQTIGTDIGSNAGAPPAGWTVNLTADNTNKCLTITATGVVGHNIRWVALLETVEVAFA